LSACILRVDVGGKLLTNHLKELISFRQWNMMDQTYIMDDVKEKCCYVSSAFKADMELSRYVPLGDNPMPVPRVMVRTDAVHRLGQSSPPTPLFSNTFFQTSLSVDPGGFSNLVKPSRMRHGRF
jgi:hypothetical protein